MRTTGSSTGIESKTLKLGKLSATIKSIEIIGDRFWLRATFDLINSTGGVYGFDVYDEDGGFLAHYEADDEETVVSNVKWDFYRVAL